MPPILVGPSTAHGFPDRPTLSPEGFEVVVKMGAKGRTN